jgi:hypothetical protein
MSSKPISLLSIGVSELTGIKPMPKQNLKHETNMTQTQIQLIKILSRGSNPNEIKGRLLRFSTSLFPKIKQTNYDACASATDCISLQWMTSSRLSPFTNKIK